MLIANTEEFKRAYSYRLKRLRYPLIDVRLSGDNHGGEEQLTRVTLEHTRRKMKRGKGAARDVQLYMMLNKLTMNTTDSREREGDDERTER